ncbi:hypothetical protein OXX59_002843 [Metschnikowia pulcherrima]
MLEREDVRSEAFKAQLDRFKMYTVERGNHWKAQLDDASFVLHTSLWVPQQHVKSAEEYAGASPYKLEKDSAALFPEWYFHLVRNFGKKSVFHRFYCAKSRLDFVSFMHGPEIDRLQIASAMDWEFSTAVKAGFGPSLEELYEEEILNRETVETKVVAQLADMSSWLVIAARENELKSLVRFGHASYLASFLMAYDYSERSIWRIVVGLMIEVGQTREQYRVIDEKVQEFEKDPAPLLSKIRDFIIYLIEKGLFVKDLFPEILEKQARMRDLELTFNKRRKLNAETGNGNSTSTNGIDTTKFPALPGTRDSNDSNSEEIRVKLENPAPGDTLGSVRKGGKIDDFRVVQQYLKDQQGSSSTNQTNFTSIMQSESQGLGLGFDANMLQGQANGRFGQNTGQHTMLSSRESLKPNAWNAETNKCLFQEQDSGPPEWPKTGSSLELTNQMSEVDSSQEKELGRKMKQGQKDPKQDLSQDPLAGLSRKQKQKQKKALLKSQGKGRKSTPAPVSFASTPQVKNKTATPNPQGKKKNVHVERKSNPNQNKTAKQNRNLSQAKDAPHNMDLNPISVPANDSNSFLSQKSGLGHRNPHIQNPAFTQKPLPTQNIASPQNMPPSYQNPSFRASPLPNQDTAYFHDRNASGNNSSNQAAAKISTGENMNNHQNNISTQPAHMWAIRDTVNFPTQPSHGIARSSNPQWTAHSMRVQSQSQSHEFRRPSGKERFSPSSGQS